jgi:hypothetical protein
MGKLLFFISVIGLLYVQLLGLAGCAKEYSYEGRLTRDTIRTIDSIKPSLRLPDCKQCSTRNVPALSTWNFKYESSSSCGNITDAIIAPDGKAFTFFGPSACSVDTGIVITVFLEQEALDRDKVNVTTNNVSFEYYDNTTQSNILIAKRPQFSLIIEDYEHGTGIAKGRFSGVAKARNGYVAEIKNGNFMLKFKR